MAKIAKRSNAKRANRPNPRSDRNFETDEIIDLSRPHSKQRRQEPQPEAARIKKVELLPRNIAQEEYLDALSDETKAIIFAMGPAGTGKTMLATLFALKELQEGRCRKIIITRPAIGNEESHGYLPGTLIDKMQPWVAPILDLVKELYPVKMVEQMVEDEIIHIVPFSFMRGRSFKGAIVLADEVQNTTPNQMKMLLTRIGDNSRMILTGDLRQHDRGYEANGLKDFLHKLQVLGSPHIAVCEFGLSDVERHPVIEDVLRIYGD